MKNQKKSGKLNLKKIKISRFESSDVKGGFISHTLSPTATQPLCQTDEYDTCNTYFLTDVACV